MRCSLLSEVIGWYLCVSYINRSFQQPDAFWLLMVQNTFKNWTSVKKPRANSLTLLLSWFQINIQLFLGGEFSGRRKKTSRSNKNELSDRPEALNVPSLRLLYPQRPHEHRADRQLSALSVWCVLDDSVWPIQHVESASAGWWERSVQERATERATFTYWVHFLLIFFITFKTFYQTCSPSVAALLVRTVAKEAANSQAERFFFSRRRRTYL